MNRNRRIGACATCGGNMVCCSCRKAEQAGRLLAEVDSNASKDRLDEARRREEEDWAAIRMASLAAWARAAWGDE